MNNSKNSINNVYSFKKVIDDIINANLANKGMVKYVSAKVVGVNSNGTVNVYIPPDNSNIVNGLANKSGEILATGDSVELCTKNGSLKNAWIAVKHGINSAGGATDNFPIGSIIAYGGTEIPNNWLVCDGSAVSRETYKELFEKIGTIYGDGDGSTTFNLPNYGGRVPVGLDKNDTDFDTLGATLGEKKHTLTVSEIPSHYHDLSVHSGGNTSAPISGVANTSNASASGLLTDSRFRIQNTGGGQSHNNIQSSIVANYIIKASNLTGYVKSTQAEVIDNLTNTSTTDALSANMGKKLNDSINLINFEIGVSEDKNWHWKKYNNGMIELYHHLNVSTSITNNYVGPNGYGTYWTQTPVYNYPIVLKEIYSGNTTIVSDAHLTNFNYSTLNNTYYQGYLYDYLQLNSVNVTINTYIVGTWK